MSRCDERLKARVEESTCLTCTGSHDKMVTFFFLFVLFFLGFGKQSPRMRRRPIPAERAAASAEMMRQMQQIKPEHLPPVHVVIYQVVIHANPEAC
jgi:hypothetical protein